MRALWELAGSTDEAGHPAPHWLHFSPEGDKVLRDFEGWLEPQLAEGEDLSLLAGWANKLAGACARIAGILHMADAVGAGGAWGHPISADIVRRAVRLCRDYLLPHAQAAFALMGADEKVERARRVWATVRRWSENKECSENAPLSISRREIHQLNRRAFPSVEELDPIIGVLVDRYFLRLPPDPNGLPGRGHKSPSYLVNHLALAIGEETPRTHCTQRTHSGADAAASEDSENSESAPSSSSEEEDWRGEAWEGD
jgi:hypothetical protein